MASVKWLTRIHAVNASRFTATGKTSDYAYWHRLDGQPVRRALRELQVKSEIAKPVAYETLMPNHVYTVCRRGVGG